MSDELHDRIAKILRLANNEGATQEERDAAMAKAQEVAFKYNLQLADIEWDDKEEITVGAAPAQWMHEWEQMLLGAVAKVNFCRTGHYLGRTDPYKRKRVFIYGKKHNIVASMDLFEYLHRQVLLVIDRETARRDKRMQYARMVLIEIVKDLAPTQYMRRVIEEHDDAETASPFSDFRYLNTDHDALIEAAAVHLQGNEHLLKGTAGIAYIMHRTGLTASYASEIRPYLKRGEYAPEIVKNMGVWKKSFLLGLVARLDQRLHDKFASLVDEAGSSGMELIRKEDAGLDEFDEDFEESKQKEHNLDRKGLVAGVDAAEEVNLDKYATLTQTEGRQLNA